MHLERRATEVKGAGAKSAVLFAAKRSQQEVAAFPKRRDSSVIALFPPPSLPRRFRLSRRSRTIRAQEIRQKGAGELQAGAVSFVHIDMRIQSEGKELYCTPLPTLLMRGWDLVTFCSVAMQPGLSTLFGRRAGSHQLVTTKHPTTFQSFFYAL